MKGVEDTSGPPANVKYKPFTGWLAKAICCTGPTKFEITALDFVNVPRMRLATACNNKN